jgi:threonine/homoserine/homoserine lactone efflux protein
MDLSAWLSIVGICLLGAMSPGPSLAVVVRNTLRGSRRAGIVTAVAHAGGVGGHALLTVTGLTALFALQPGWRQLLAWAGALYLAWLGYRALRSGGIAPLPLDTAAQAGSLGAAARDGLLIALLNPKLALFFLALFSQFISARPALVEVIILVSTATLIDAGWYSLVATWLSRPGVLERLRRHARRIDQISGVVFILLAVRVFTL